MIGLMPDTRPIVSMATWKAEAVLVGAIFSDIESGIAGADYWPAMMAYVAALGKEQAKSVPMGTESRLMCAPLLD
jgi:hypothetical protein